LREAQIFLKTFCAVEKKKVRRIWVRDNLKKNGKFTSPKNMGWEGGRVVGGGGETQKSTEFQKFHPPSHFEWMYPITTSQAVV
jgi:hypothetical protein